VVVFVEENCKVSRVDMKSGIGCVLGLSILSPPAVCPVASLKLHDVGGDLWE
jgi:hypothetical protein